MYVRNPLVKSFIVRWMNVKFLRRCFGLIAHDDENYSTTIQLHIQAFILRTLNQCDAQIADVIPRAKELKNKQSQTSDWMGCLQIYAMTLPNVWWYLLTDTDSSNPFICMTLENGILYIYIYIDRILPPPRWIICFNRCNIKLQLDKWLFCASSFEISFSHLILCIVIVYS